MKDRGVDREGQVAVRNHHLTIGAFCHVATCGDALARIAMCMLYHGYACCVMIEHLRAGAPGRSSVVGGPELMKLL